MRWGVGSLELSAWYAALWGLDEALDHRHDGHSNFDRLLPFGEWFSP